jgi:HEAT repeat protein
VMTNSAKMCIMVSGKLKAPSCRHALLGFIYEVLAIFTGFLTHPMISSILSKRRVAGLIAILTSLAPGLAAQTSVEREFVASAGSGWWFWVFLMVFAGFGAAFMFWRMSRRGADQPQFHYDNRYANYYKNESYELSGLDTEKELEWLRKAKKSTSKPSKLTFDLTTPGSVGAKPEAAVSRNSLDIDTREFQNKMRRLQYSQLPINSFRDLMPSKLYEPLPLSNEAALLSAIEQANEEFEEDESVRDLALRILVAYRTRNSVEALSQIALYDLSSSLRSKAVSTLTDFDHESVFEAILLACADPTREVRAAAARGLFRLSFDRADAWKRIIETNDEFRMSHAARAAIESGIVVKSFDRLVHEDLKVAYEAFTLVCLMIRSGETECMFDALKNHRDERVKFALLQVLKVQGDQRTLAALNKLSRENTFSTDVAERLRDAIISFDGVTA